jgi:D-aspartate ligase
MTAAVVIGDHTQGLGIVRSAAAVADCVWVVNDSVLSIGRFSKHLSGYRRIRRGTLRQLDQAPAVELLLDALRDLPVEPPALLLGVNEDITRFVHQNAAILRRKYFVPDVRFERIYDKYELNALLPESVRLDTRLCSETDLASVGDPEAFILKGRQGNAFRRITAAKALRLSQLSEQDRVDLFDRIPPEQVLVQEVVETDQPVVSVCSFSVDGDVAGLFGYQKLRQHPSRFGTGSYLRSARVDRLLPIVSEILASLNFTGISEIEFIHDDRTGAYKVVEINPRTWKSVHFATQCGQNLVAGYLRFVATGAVTRDLAYATDRYWTDLATDVPQMLRELKLRGYERGVFECTWDRSDPWPAVALWTLFPLIVVEDRLPIRSA